MNDMKVTMKVSMAGVANTYPAGSIYEGTDDECQRLIDAGMASSVSQAKVSEDATEKTVSKAERSTKGKPRPE